MTKNNDVLGAILASAIMSSAMDKVQKQADAEPEVNQHLENAREVRKNYEAFLQVGFTEEQAIQLLCAALN